MSQNKKNMEAVYGEWIDQIQDAEQRRLDIIGGFFKMLSWLGFFASIIIGVELSWGETISVILSAFVWGVFQYIGGKIQRDF